MKFTFEQQGFIGILKLYGELSLERESELTEALMVSLDNSDYLVVSLHHASILNTNALKPIWSAQQIAMKQNKDLKVIGLDEKALTSVVNHENRKNDFKYQSAQY